MSVYHVVGTRTTSWEEAAADAIKTAGQSVRDLRVAESSSRTSTSGLRRAHLPHQNPAVLQIRTGIVGRRQARSSLGLRR
jgi:flavin-binding protein dodecin